MTGIWTYYSVAVKTVSHYAMETPPRMFCNFHATFFLSKSFSVNTIYNEKNIVFFSNGENDWTAWLACYIIRMGLYDYDMIVK